AARPHDFLHDHGHPPDDQRHDTQVVQNGEKRGYEDDDGQHLKCKYDPEGAALGPQRSEYKIATRFGEIQHGIHHRAGDLEHLPEFRLEHQHCEGELQPQTPQYDARPNGMALRGEQVCTSENGQDAEQAGETTHLEPGAETRTRANGLKPFRKRRPDRAFDFWEPRRYATAPIKTTVCSTRRARRHPTTSSIS